MSGVGQSFFARSRKLQRVAHLYKGPLEATEQRVFAISPTLLRLCDPPHTADCSRAMLKSLRWNASGNGSAIAPGARNLYHTDIGSRNQVVCGGFCGFGMQENEA